MNQKEITAFYLAHSRRLFNMSCRIVGQPEDAEEIVQDTILKFVRLPLRPMTEEQVSAWLARTCIRASIDRLRRRERRNSFLKDYARWQDDTPFADPAGEPSPLPDITQVRDAMDALPENYRLVLDLVLIEGLDYGEIAALTGRKEPTLRSLYSRGRCKLIEMLKKI